MEMVSFGELNCMNGGKANTQYYLQGVQTETIAGLYQRLISNSFQSQNTEQRRREQPTEKLRRSENDIRKQKPAA